MYYVCGSNCSDQTEEAGKKSGYHILLGSFSQYNEAFDFQMRLLWQGVSVCILPKGTRYFVISDCFANLEEAAFYEHYLRQLGFNTMLLR